MAIDLARPILLTRPRCCRHATLSAGAGMIPSRPPVGFIDVEMKAVSLHAEDVYPVSGQVETKSGISTLEFCGVVAAAVGPGTCDMRVDDRVVVTAPNYFTINERVPAWTADRLLPEEGDEVLAFPALAT
ncbi:hypothetical protein GGR56DRAFT_646932 [Xylariaceae sp. FL0804]|nr:hypothetical protein GGR56DRAFT_646932 [Xylariaceae sp. FL0804]